MFNTLSGRFLILTIVFVMLAEVLIFVPSVARFRQDYLNTRLERAQIASLALEAEDMLSSELEAELLATAEVYNVVLRRNSVRQLVLSSPIPLPVSASYDMRDASPLRLIYDAMLSLFDSTEKVIRVLGDPVQGAGLMIEVTMSSTGLRMAMLSYGLRVFWLSAAISIFTAVLLFWAVRRALVLPISSVVSHMKSYANAPEDARRIITPDAQLFELREAQEAMQSMQIELTGALKQKERMAQLGGAVAKISHDLRNILTSAQLFTDRIEGSKDPTVARLAPKLVRSISRAVNLCETTLVYGRAKEPPPRLESVDLARLFEDVLEGERLMGLGGISYHTAVQPGLELQVDPEQMYRVISNLCRNARQALEGAHRTGTINLAGGEDLTNWWIKIEDNGPGLPKRALESLFTAFQGGTTKGGSGLGLAISAELVRGHGGSLVLEKTNTLCTIFAICLPKGNN
ncbi:MAG: HAMP domain-containing sensor histidine kinase [Planktomarina sp.]|nr:HAMP domain-containing sensor histidine kinase [Planktomarina sp.]